MTISVGGGKGLDRRSAMEVGEDARDGIDECALAVCAGAPEEEQRVLAGQAGERIAAHPLQVLLQHLVAAGNAIKEGTPQRAGVLAGRDRGYAGDQVLGAVLAHDAGAQVDHAIGCVEQPRVGVPLFDRRYQTMIRARHLHDCGNRLVARQPLPKLAVATRGRLPTDQAGVVVVF